MSLKKFHIFFMISTGLLSLFLITWGALNYTSLSSTSLAMISVGIVMIPFLIYYLKWFLKKMNQLSIAFCMILSFGTLLLNSPELKACTVCFKDPNDPSVKAIFFGVGFLALVIIGILVSIIFIARQWVKRAHALGQEI